MADQYKGALAGPLEVGPGGGARYTMASGFVVQLSLIVAFDVSC